MKIILLTKGQVAKVDDEDYGRVNRYKWYAWWNVHTNSYYAKRRRQPISMPNLIMGVKSEQIVDHISHDTLDNRRSNLRLATVSQNGANRRRACNNTSGYVGVTWHKYHRCWRAQIQFQGKQIHLGLFKTKEGAKKFRDRAARFLFGEFAV